MASSLAKTSSDLFAKDSSCYCCARRRRCLATQKLVARFEFQVHPAPPEREREGYSFAGWPDLPAFSATVRSREGARAGQRSRAYGREEIEKFQTKRPGSRHFLLPFEKRQLGASSRLACSSRSLGLICLRARAEVSLANLIEFIRNSCLASLSRADLSK